ncbi:MAG: glutamine-hydrolyzing carbamoyl-phosphate synthase small subunit [Candidatus ainarchaeum sp.]|nr:glutamine-hydrolyzing carbamoyl-phosphate synthase small subunit [Candidatus ainarchaeum sp.]
MKAVLALKDGTVIHGTGFGAIAENVGELVFNTSMTGYEEALTDPSYAGQILLMTYPLIGNYGINGKDRESNRIHPPGFVVRELSRDYEHRQANASLDAFLKQSSVPGMQGIDTRFLVRHIREKGVMPAIIATSEKDIDVKRLVERMNRFDYSSVDFVKEVTVKKAQVLNKGGKKKVVLIDYGAKAGIARELVARGCEVHILPASASAGDVKALEPHGVVLSNGPGDPAILKYAHETIRGLEGYRPMFGVCLGNQLIAHAFGGDTFKLKFGHRGANHAVLDVKANKTSITTQNHGFAVGKVPKGFEVSHINVNDRSVEGLRSGNKAVFSVQYHPEATPGPHDSRYLFDEFMKMM